MQVNPGTFTPESSLISQFFFVFVLIVIGIVILVIHMIKSSRNNKPRNYGVLEHGYSAKLVSDTIEHEPVSHGDLECPRDDTKYSYTFFLKIDDYYCNRGYWKCIMIKGTQVPADGHTKCKDLTQPAEVSLEKCFEYENRVGNETILDDIKGKLNSGIEEVLNLKTKLELEDKGIKILGNQDLFKRLDLICRALEVDKKQADKTGSNMVCDAATNCGFFKDEKEKPYPMNEGICQDFLAQHKTYCEKVYALDKKVARLTEEERIQKIQSLEKQAEALENIDIRQVLKDEITALKKKALKERKYDDYDGICSVDNYLNEYPELIPRTLEKLKENNLINLSKKNRMDLHHEIRNPINLEGCYKTTDFTEPPTNVIDFQQGVEVNYETCNREAEKNGYDYFGLSSTDSCTGYFESDLVGKKIHPNTGNCDISTRKGTKDPYIYISKVVRPGDNVVSECWNTIIERFAYQSPGIWLHPFVNNIRICFTTNSSQEYTSFVNDYSHANKGNPANLEVRKIPGPMKEHAAVQPPIESQNGCQTGTTSLTNNYYREYFDIFNIPINNEFHLAVVVNGKAVEVYLDGNLTQTVKLFGDPTINTGELQISPEKNPKLGGTVKEFKFFPYSIDYLNINKIIENRKAKQSLGGEPLLVAKDHAHHIEISHEHEYHPIEEDNHRHSVGDGDIPQEYN